MDPAAAAWADPDSFATTLVALAVDRLDPGCLSWHPEALRLEVGDAFAIEPAEWAISRLMAGALCVTTDRIYRSVPDFNLICRVLSGATPTPGAWTPADAMQCAWGITEGMLLGPPEARDDEPFSAEVRRYVGAACAEEGIRNPPDVLRIGIAPDGWPPPVPAGTGLDEAVREIESRRSAEISERLRDGLRRLVAQLSALPLRNGSARGLVERITAGKTR